VIPAFRTITDEVKAAGAVIDPADLPRWRAWRFRPELSAALVAFGRAVLSRQRWQPRDDGAEIEELLDAHVAAAVRAKAAGFQGVEVWAAYHSLLDQFWTPWSNQRDRPVGRKAGKPDAVLARADRACAAPAARISSWAWHQLFSGYEVTLGAEALCEIVDLHDRPGMSIM
jgi:2,4-dienoyl-CoA reductase-like NADH-dependent reductase (Old Yellow Enzyme family)